MKEVLTILITAFVVNFINVIWRWKKGEIQSSYGDAIGGSLLVSISLPLVIIIFLIRLIFSKWDIE